MKKLIDNTYKNLKEEVVKGANMIEQKDGKKIKSEIENIKESDN